ncbi:MAG: germination protein YpeB [Clostridia bacterium]|nr:germination protein YpeB [Clostridia bacterium]
MAKAKQKSKANIGLIIALSIVSALLVLFVTLYSIQSSNNTTLANSLEDIYQKNIYELVDNVNNTETKLSKMLSSNDNAFRAKMLREVSYNTDMAQSNLNNLPYTINGVNESIAFVNQVSGYTETLSKSLEKGGNLSSQDLDTLERVYDNILVLKQSLTKFSENNAKGYSILKQSNAMDGEFNKFTKEIGLVTDVNVEYPTMIYDGPFSDSVVNKKIEGLNDADVGEEAARENLLKVFSNLSDGDVELRGETKGKFETFDFTAKNEAGKQTAYIQMTKKGGKLLTMSSVSDKRGEKISMENAEKTALKFAEKNGIKNAKVVWSDKLSGNAYFNIAPVADNIVLYPDLVKIKVDLYNGNILGYEASSYYTNHKSRTFTQPVISMSTAKSKIEKKFNIKFSRLALIPLEYNQEILTYEFACNFANDDYYFYYDVDTGELVNVLKVIKTNNGSLLM